MRPLTSRSPDWLRRAYTPPNSAGFREPLTLIAKVLGVPAEAVQLTVQI